MAQRGKKADNKMETVAEGIYRRNGVYIVPIWNPDRGKAGGKDWHTLGPERCGHCKKVHERRSANALNDARALKRELEREKANGRGRRREKTVAEWAGRYEPDGAGGEDWVKGEWLEVMPRKSETTNIHNDGRVRPLAREFAGRTLASITEEEAAIFAQEHPGTFKEVHAMFNDACALQLLERNPFAGISVPRSEGREHIVVLTDHELEQLAGIAEAIHGPFGRVIAAMIRTAAWTGLRPSELFLVSREPGDQLNYADLDAGELDVQWQLGQKTKRVGRPKKESQRKIMLLPGAEAALRSIETWTVGMPLFLTKRGKPFDQRNFFYYWDPVRKAFVAALPAGHHLRQRMADRDENLDFYELRHFFGTKLAHPPRGVPAASPQDIAKMMGHKDGGQLAMKIYIHTEEKDARDRIRDAWKRAS